MFAPRGANSPPARHRREAPALWREGKRVPGGAKGSVCPVGTWARRDQDVYKRQQYACSMNLSNKRFLISRLLPTNDKNCNFVLWVGNKRLIKKRLFDKFIEQAYCI